MWSPAAVDALVFFPTNAVWQAQTASGPSVRKADFPLRSRTSGPRHSMLYASLRIRLTRLEMTDPHIDRSLLTYDPRLDFQVIQLIALNIAWVNMSKLAQSGTRSIAVVYKVRCPVLIPRNARCPWGRWNTLQITQLGLCGNLIDATPDTGTDSSVNTLHPTYYRGGMMSIHHIYNAMTCYLVINLP